MRINNPSIFMILLAIAPGLVVTGALWYFLGDNFPWNPITLAPLLIGVGGLVAMFLSNRNGNTQAVGVFALIWLACAAVFGQLALGEFVSDRDWPTLLAAGSGLAFGTAVAVLVALSNRMLPQKTAKLHVQTSSDAGTSGAKADVSQLTARQDTAQLLKTVLGLPGGGPVTEVDVGKLLEQLRERARAETTTAEAFFIQQQRETVKMLLEQGVVTKEQVGPHLLEQLGIKLPSAPEPEPREKKKSHWQGEGGPIVRTH